MMPHHGIVFAKIRVHANNEMEAFDCHASVLKRSLYNLRVNAEFSFHNLMFQRVQGSSFLPVFIRNNSSSRVYVLSHTCALGP